MQIKEIFCDVETSGTDLMRHGLFMIGGIIRIDGQIKEEFKITCDLFADDEFDLESTKNHGYMVEDLHKFQDPIDAHKELTDIFGKYCDKFDKSDKYFFINFGAEFDNKFLRRWFEGCGDNYFGSWFFMPWLDVMSLSAQYLKRERYLLPNFKLVTVAKHLQIPVDPTQIHDSLYDARLAMQVYDIIDRSREDRQKEMNKNLTKTDDGQLVYKLELKDVPRKRRI